MPAAAPSDDPDDGLTAFQRLRRQKGLKVVTGGLLYHHETRGCSHEAPPKKFFGERFELLRDQAYMGKPPAEADDPFFTRQLRAEPERPAATPMLSRWLGRVRPR